MEEKYVDPRALENGEVLLALKHTFLNNRIAETLYPLASCLRDSHVFVPMDVVMSDRARELLENGADMSEVAPEDIMVKPDFVKKNTEQYFPMFSNMAQMDEEYRSQFTMLKIGVTECIEMARNYSNISGLVLDPFTEPLIVEFRLADEIMKLDSKLRPETAE